MSDSLPELRATKGLSQQQIAKALGTSQPAYSDIEQGKRALSEAHARKLAALLQVDQVALKHAHASAGVMYLLKQVSQLSDAEVLRLLRDGHGANSVSKALRALDAIQSDTDVPDDVRQASSAAVKQLASAVTKAVEKQGIRITNDGRDAFGRRRAEPEKHERDLFGRSPKNAW